MLPIDPILPELCETLMAHGRAVLQAPPGAGKTTRVPLALAEHVEGKIIMLEPRRIAARAAAERLAEDMPDGAVGYRMRGASRPGGRIEVVTEGILTRMVQEDPELAGIGAVIFDEFHERSLNADLGLALTMEARAALRPDLKLLVMSATLDGEAVAALLGNAPIVTSEGRAFPVEIRHLPRPRGAQAALKPDCLALIKQAHDETEGGILVFLPGEREIREMASALATSLPKSTIIQPLFGALPFEAQQAALRPLPSGRKLVLATSIAETSLTIEDIRVVVDAGLARRARFDPNSGMSRLVTERVTRAEAKQRAGRAGRVAPGTAYRLWAAAEEGALQAFPPPEITEADLTGLALELALWGSTDLPFLTPPPEGSLSEARALLERLGALDNKGGVTTHGRALARLPVPPRLAHILQKLGSNASDAAALLSDRDIMAGAGTDLAARLSALRGTYSGPGSIDRGALKRLKSEAKRLARLAPKGKHYPGDGIAVAEAFPDRIGQRRKGTEPRWLLSGGRGAIMDPADALAASAFLVAPNLQGGGREARIHSAIALSKAELLEAFANQITQEQLCEWSRKEKRVVAKQRSMLGAICLSEQNWQPSETHIARAMCDGIRQIGLRLSPAAQRFQKRVALLRQAEHNLPNLEDEALLERLEDWLLPFLGGINTAAAFRALDLLPALRAQLDWGQQQLLDREAPAAFPSPLGRKIPISYEQDQPTIEVRLQEMLGVSIHPLIGKTPIKVILLSPAQRPIQITTDLPGFWRGSYVDLRKDMRAQYPKHLWPEDPEATSPTLRAKPRK